MKLFQQLLNEVTLDALVDSTNDNFSDKTIRSNESNKIHVNQITYSTGNVAGVSSKAPSGSPELAKISNQLRDLKKQTSELTTRARRWDAAVKLNKKASVYGELKTELSDIFKQIRDINKIYPNDLLVYNESLVSLDEDVANTISSNFEKLKKYAGEKKAQIVKQYDIYKARRDLKQIKNELGSIYKNIEQLIPSYKKVLGQGKSATPTSKNILQANAVANSAGKQYKMSIVFDDVQYHSNKAGDLVTIEDTTRNQHYVTPISDNDVRVVCECMDFRFRFAYANHQQKALIGQPQEYTKKPGSTRPPVNPEGRIGLCKHLIAFQKELKRGKLIQ